MVGERAGRAHRRGPAHGAVHDPRRRSPASTAGPYSDADVSTAPDPVRTTTIRARRAPPRGARRLRPVRRGVPQRQRPTTSPSCWSPFGVAYDSVIGGPLASGTSEAGRPRRHRRARRRRASQPPIQRARPVCSPSATGAPRPLLLQLLTGVGGRRLELAPAARRRDPPRVARPARRGHDADVPRRLLLLSPARRRVTAAGAPTSATNAPGSTPAGARRPDGAQRRRQPGAARRAATSAAPAARRGAPTTAAAPSGGCVAG